LPQQGQLVRQLHAARGEPAAHTLQPRRIDYLTGRIRFSATCGDLGPKQFLAGTRAVSLVETHNLGSLRFLGPGNTRVAGFIVPRLPGMSIPQAVAALFANLLASS
jgi:hypothetical protein